MPGSWMAPTSPGPRRARQALSVVRVLVGAALLGLATSAVTGPVSPASAEPGTTGASALAAPAPRAYGLTVTGKLVRFDVDEPAAVEPVAAVGDLGADDVLVGIDIRPQGRSLYGVGNNGGVFTLDAATAVPTDVGQLDAPLVGLHLGLDVDPTEDEIRVVSNAGQNLSYDPVTDTTTVDHVLNYPPSSATARGAVGLAYTNSDTVRSTRTKPYAIDIVGDQLARLADEGSGTVSAVGPLGVDASGEGGFDAVNALRGYAVLRTDAGSGLYTVNLRTGAATLVGMFPATMKVVDLAVPMP